MSILFEAVVRDGVIVLPTDAPSPARCLVAIVDDNVDQLRQEAKNTIPEPQQQRMGELLRKNQDGQLTDAEQAELDDLGRVFDMLTLRRGRALSILAQLDLHTRPA